MRGHDDGVAPGALVTLHQVEPKTKFVGALELTLEGGGLLFGKPRELGQDKRNLWRAKLQPHLRDEACALYLKESLLPVPADVGIPEECVLLYSLVDHLLCGLACALGRARYYNWRALAGVLGWMAPAATPLSGESSCVGKPAQRAVGTAVASRGAEDSCGVGRCWLACSE